MTVFLSLALEFMKTGLFSIGGGLATLPFLYRIADNYTWFTREELIDMIAISESTPGAIGLNMSTYAGFSAGGPLGGVLATFSLIAPSVVIIAAVAGVLDRFKENRFVKGAFYGTRPTVTALIASTALGIIKMTLFGRLDITRFTDISISINYGGSLLFLAVFYLLRRYKKHPVCYIAAAALVGALFKF